MFVYAVRRLLQALPVLLLTTVMVFSILHLIPGDPAAALAGGEAPPEQVAALRKAMNLDEPLVLQYVKWLGRMVRGDLGKSFVSGMQVRDLILARIPATMELAGAGMLVGLLLGVPSGIVAAVRRRGTFDVIVTAINSLLLSVPNFWSGLAFIMLFALALGWLPPSGRVSVLDDPATGIKFLILPALTLGLHIAAVLSRFTKAALLEALHEDYVRTARAKGLVERVVILRHALRTALVPVITIMGLQVGHLLGGSVVVESVFAWPGMGRLIVDSLGNRDYTAVQGSLLVFVTVFILINLTVDLTYAWIDPRIRLERARKGG